MGSCLTVQTATCEKFAPGMSLALSDHHDGCERHFPNSVSHSFLVAANNKLKDLRQEIRLIVKEVDPLTWGARVQLNPHGYPSVPSLGMDPEEPPT